MTRFSRCWLVRIAKCYLWAPSNADVASSLFVRRVSNKTIMHVAVKLAKLQPRRFDLSTPSCRELTMQPLSSALKNVVRKISQLKIWCHILIKFVNFDWLNVPSKGVTTSVIDSRSTNIKARVPPAFLTSAKSATVNSQMTIVASKLSLWECRMKQYRKHNGFSRWQVWNNRRWSMTRACCS
jgi:hypothetical protein